MKVSPSAPPSSVTYNTSSKKQQPNTTYKWWTAKNKDELCGQLIGTAAYLKESQQYRYRQTAIYARLYGNQSLYNFIGSNMSKLDAATGLPTDRPTFNLVQSATDTLVSRIGQSRPSPVFLTDAGNYKERLLAKKLNNFTQGEFYQTKAYEKGVEALRDSLVEGTGCIKIYRDAMNRVALDRVLLTELLTDPNEGIYREPRQLFQLKLIDRDVLIDNFPTFKKAIEDAAKAYPDNSADSSKSISDLVMVVEGWHLPSGPHTNDGRHTIACSGGIILDEKWTKPKFPFVFLHYSPRMLGFWSQGLAEQLMGTQLEINSLLYTISKAIKLVGVPRVFIEDSSKVVSAHNNNDVGVIIKYRGTMPKYEVAPCNAPELYEQLQRMINYGYQQCGVSTMQAGGQKPQGLDSGEAQRVYDDISTDRFNTLSRRYDNLFIDLAYAIVDEAKDIAEDEGEYQTVYPNKNGTREIDLPKLDILKNPFVIQCFNTSSLPRDPAGRMAKVTEMIQSGMVTIKEGRRLLDFPDLDQMERLANAGEERIFQYLDDIIEEGKYQGPDPFMPLDLAQELSVQYYNLYASAKLEEDKQEMIRTFYAQAGALKTAATPQPMPGAPQAAPMPLPQSQLIPNAQGQTPNVAA